MDEELDGTLPSPFHAFAPGLPRKAERWPALPVHPRVVHAQTPTGERTIVLASFSAPAGLRAFHAALKPRIEAALLAELSRPASELAADVTRLSAIELYLFAPLPFDCAPALSPFGLSPASLDEPESHRAQALLRREAQLVDGALADEASTRFRAPFARASHPFAEPLAEALRAQAPKAGWGAWGTRPGALARACADQLRTLGYGDVEPTRAGIERLEAVIVPRAHGLIRWLDPLSFQALCDLIAVAGVASYGRSIEWAACEPDEETGLAPPPLLRVERDGESFHLPLGEHVLRWCIMPSDEREQIPSLGAWAEHEFT